MSRIQRWAKMTTRDAGREEHDVRRALRWMAEHSEGVARHEWAGGTSLQAEEHVRELVAVVDLPPDRIALGPCESCARPLNAPPDERWHRCWCGQQIDVRARRAELLSMADDYLLNATDMSHALTSLGEPATPERIHKWRERGRLMPRATPSGRPVYRVGEVRELLIASARRRAA
jgi:hypothetical protein